jgi:D-hydroxyproline dehydrogenase subunit alpha
MTASAELVIVGAGPAGLHAALQAADAGVEVLILDENRHIGGQIYRHIPYRIQDPARLGKDHQKAKALVDAIGSRSNIKVLPESIVWGAFGGTTIVAAHQGVSREITGGALLIAGGAYDRAAPFPGWTLPGVLSAGGALTMLKSQRVAPGRRVLLAGTGPIQLVLARCLLDAGVEVVALLDAASPRRHWRSLPGLIAEPALLWEGLGYLSQLRMRGVRTLYGHTIRRALGGEKVEQAVVTRVDIGWHAIPGTERTIDVDAVICSFGFVPAIELTTLCGCEHDYRPAVGGWVPRHTNEMETTVPRVFVAGETTGIAGAVVAAEEGKVAGIGAAARLGHLSADEAHRRSEGPRRKLARLYKFRAALDDLYGLGAGLTDLIDPETIVCRCEDIDAATIGRTISDGASSLRDVKLGTRAGMGPCQGRMCGPSIAALLARQRGAPIDRAGLPSIRPPAKPVPLEALL